MQYSLCNDSVADDRKDNFNTDEEEEEKATKNSRVCYELYSKIGIWKDKTTLVM